MPPTGTATCACTFASTSGRRDSSRSVSRTGSRRPVAVVTTSGTAVGNLLPAVMEAHHTGRRVVVVSADRPDRLRGTGANQTTDQAGIFGTFAPCHDLTASSVPPTSWASLWGKRVRAAARPSSTSSSTVTCCRRTPIRTRGGSAPTTPPRRTSRADPRPEPHAQLRPGGLPRGSAPEPHDNSAPADFTRGSGPNPTQLRPGGLGAAGGTGGGRRAVGVGADRRGGAPTRTAHRRRGRRRRRAGCATARRGRQLAARRRADVRGPHRAPGPAHRPAAAHDRPARCRRARRRRRSPDPVAPGHQPHQRLRGRGPRRPRT